MKSIFYLFFAFIIVGAPTISCATSRHPWVLVDTKKITLTVFSADDHVIARFPNIAIGSGGAAEKHLRDDDTTPLGTFHVAWINRHSRFGTFFGLDYPTVDQTIRAYFEGVITAAEFDAFIKAFRQHRIPPQNTPLGGQLGIHGLGNGNPQVQQTIDWTDGCVAVTNREIGMLSHWVQIGTKVVIR
ncbi:MAG: L,D-transpeptidase family protein [Sulfuriferula sp.]